MLRAGQDSACTHVSVRGLTVYRPICSVAACLQALVDDAAAIRVAVQTCNLVWEAHGCNYMIVA